jgi:tetraacyldisaccharide 4'-kinase
MPERPAAAARLEALWYGQAPVPLGLRLLAALNGAVLGLRRRLYAAGALPVARVARPVVVIGNLTVGGTGKTPLTAWLVDALRQRGHAPGIASRGYGREGRDVRSVEPGDDPTLVGDEPLMLRRQTGAPVCVAPRRRDAALRLIATGCDFIVCDDGLQHLALGRDLQLAVVDAARGFGNGRLLPAGPLREPTERLRDVDAIVLNGVLDGAAEMALVLPAGVPVLHMSLAPGDLLAVNGTARQPLAGLAGRSVHAVTGIGHPQRFFRLLREAGARVHEHAFPDHHRFGAADIAFDDELPVIMTAKDAVKCAACADARHWVLPVRAEFPPAEAQWLVDRVLALRGPEGSKRD